MLKNLKPGSLRDAKHRLFYRPELYAAVKAFRSLPLNHKKCESLLTWLNESVYCVSSQQLNVEGSFNILTDIIETGRGRRRSSTEVSITVTYKPCAFGKACCSVRLLEKV